MAEGAVLAIAGLGAEEARLACQRINDALDGGDASAGAGREGGGDQDRAMRL